MRKLFKVTAHLWLYSLPLAAVLALVSGSWRIGLLSVIASLSVQTVHALNFHEEEFAAWFLGTVAVLIFGVLTSFGHFILAVADGWPLVVGFFVCVGVALWDFGWHMRRHTREKTGLDKYAWLMSLFISFFFLWYILRI
jgi:hypothetical protein